MSKWYQGKVTIDEIDLPVTIGRTVFSIVGSVTITVECEVDPGYWRDANGDGCPPSEIQRDYTVADCDLSLMLGDVEVATIREYGHLGEAIRNALLPRLDKACEDCECSDEVEAA